MWKRTCARLVVLGQNGISWFSDARSPQRLAGQLSSAVAFAEAVKQEYSEATFSTTGHSLGEYLALYIAAENQWKNVGFNGPDPYEVLTPVLKSGSLKILAG